MPTPKRIYILGLTEIVLWVFVYTGYSKTDWIPSGTWCFIVSKLSKHGEVLGPKWNFQSPFKFLWSLIFAVEIQWFLYPLCTLLPLKPPRSSESLPNPLPKGFVLRERSGVRMFRGKKEKKGCQLIAPKCTFPPPIIYLFTKQYFIYIHFVQGNDQYNCSNNESIKTDCTNPNDIGIPRSENAVPICP